MSHVTPSPGVKFDRRETQSWRERHDSIGLPEDDCSGDGALEWSATRVPGKIRERCSNSSPCGKMVGQKAIANHVRVG